LSPVGTWNRASFYFYYSYIERREGRLLNSAGTFLYIQVPHSLGVGLDETLARVHRISHEHVESAANSAAWTTVTGYLWFNFMITRISELG
jgi:hypothetical protein